MYHADSVQFKLLRVRLERQVLNSMHRDQLLYSLLSELYMVTAPENHRKYAFNLLRTLDNNQNRLMQQQSLKNFGQRPLVFRDPGPDLFEDSPQEQTSDEDKLRYLEALSSATEGSTSFSEVLNRVSGLLNRIHTLKSTA
ncbi:MAG: hypothetical protein LHW56_01620 [Candidatus Cloacimonetes bacterium]|nr:hypothetical protein [Candidatus Cloacimonadota bacterium]MDY0171586.1 hypothetical protein [Candidatus Cloacimonadaceae bacterium]